MKSRTSDHRRRRMAGLSRAALRLQKDERLVQLVRRGSDEAFEAIVSRYRSPLLRYSTRLLDRERAEDAVQQAFLKALASLRMDGRELQLKPWLYRIVHNESVNALHRRDGPHEQLDENLDGVPQPPDVLDRSERLRTVVAGIQSLPPRQRSAIVLRELEGRSYADIADRMGATTPVVRQLLHRARERLRDACAVLLPLPWVRFLAAGDPSQSSLDRGRIAELIAGGGAGASLSKVGATVIATGVIAGGATVGVPRDDHKRDALGPRSAQAASPAPSHDQAAAPESRDTAADDRGTQTFHRRADEPGAERTLDRSGDHSLRSDRGEHSRGEDRDGHERDGDAEPVEEARDSGDEGSGDEESHESGHSGGSESGDEGAEPAASEPSAPPEPDSSGEEGSPAPEK